MRLPHLLHLHPLLPALPSLTSPLTLRLEADWYVIPQLQAPSPPWHWRVVVGPQKHYER
jgi:hypothetical protein